MAANRWYLRASSAARLAICPGSGRACWGIEGESSEAAERGTRIHSWLADSFGAPCTDDLTADELAEARLIRGHVINLVGEENYFTAEMKLARNGWSGHIDLIVEPEESGTVYLIDYKTGQARDVEVAEANAQMRVYAMLYCEPCTVSIITPHGVHSTCTYTTEDITAAAAELATIRDNALSPFARRIPSPAACQYCPAFGGSTCPETAGAVEEGHDKIVPTSAGLVALSAEDLGRLGVLWKIVKKRGGQVEDEIRARLEAGLDVPGCSLRPSGSLVTVTDVYGAITALEAQDIPATEALSMSFAKAVESVAFVRGIDKKAAKEWLEGELEGMIEIKPKAASLVIK